MYTKGTNILRCNELEAEDSLSAVYGHEDLQLYCDQSDIADVPKVPNSLSPDKFEELQSLVNPLEIESDFGINLYEQVLYFVPSNQIY